MSITQLGFGRHFMQTYLHAVRATRCKRTAVRRIEQIDRLTLDGNKTLGLLNVELGIPIL